MYTWCLPDQGFCGSSRVYLKSPIYNIAVYTSLHDISRHHTVSADTRAESNLLCMSTDDLNTCRCAHQAWRRLSCNPTSLTGEHVLIMAVLIDESVSQLSGLLLFTFSKLFKGFPYTLCDIPACAFMHLTLHAYCAWAGYYLVICPQALLTG